LNKETGVSIVTAKRPGSIDMAPSKEFSANVTPGSLEGDLEFLMVAAGKVEAIRNDLGKVGPVIAAQVEQAMLGKRKNFDTDRAERDAQATARELPIERKVHERVARLHERLAETREMFHLSPANVRATVQVALELARLSALEPVDHPGTSLGTVSYWHTSADNFRP
jgi:hypothetical protein